MDKHINFVCLFLLVSAAVSIADDEEINVCDSGGVKCSANCTQIGVCLDDASKGGYEWYPVRDCEGDEYCSCVGSSCRCVGEVGSCVPNSRKITCVSAGAYPDLYDCSQYIYCDPHASVTVASCSAGHLYDACTGACDIIGTSCSFVPPICNSIGEVFQLKSNNRIYYFCKDEGNGILHPVIGRCQKGFFDPSVGKCTGEEEAGCIMGDTSSTVSPTSATNTTTPSSGGTGSITPPTPITCNKVGSIPDPADCHSYYYCDGTLTPYHMQCSYGTFYDQQEGHCTPGSC